MQRRQSSPVHRRQAPLALGLLAPALALLTVTGSPAASATAQDTAGAQDPAESTKIVFIHGGPSHGVGAHEYRAGSILLARQLEDAVDGVETELHLNWPKDPATLDDADCVVIFSSGGGGHPLVRRLEEFAPVMKRGCGLVCLHYAVEVPKGDPGDAFLQWIGGYFETHWSVNPHWKADFSIAEDHPTTRGVDKLEVNDEWYYHMRFRDGGVTPVLSAVPPQETLKRSDGPHSGNPAVRKEVAEGIAQHVAWAFERPSGGRGFGFTGLHFHRNMADDGYRTLLLNAILWSAGGEVPEGGVPSTSPTKAELEANLDR